MRYAALDVGNKRVGVAVGNSELRLATPLTVIQRSKPKSDAAQLNRILEEYSVEAIVVGLPRQSDERVGEQEELTRAYIAALEPFLALPIHFHDERFSTASAMAQQRERGVSEKRGRATLDASAAAVILQDFLDSLDRSAD